MKELKIHLATSRAIGEKCKAWAKEQGYKLVGMDECDVFISVMYDKIIPEEFIKEHRCYNFHPGVLPWYRGAGAYSWAIINGEFETGVTLHEIDKDIDHGDVIAIGRFPITKEDTAETLFRKAENEIFEMFTDGLETLCGLPFSNPQEEGKIYYRKDLEKAKDLTKYVRAFTFEGKDNCYYYNSRGGKIELIW